MKQIMDSETIAWINISLLKNDLFIFNPNPILFLPEIRDFCRKSIPHFSLGHLWWNGSNVLSHGSSSRSVIDNLKLKYLDLPLLKNIKLK